MPEGSAPAASSTSTVRPSKSSRRPAERSEAKKRTLVDREGALDQDAPA